MQGVAHKPTAESKRLVKILALAGNPDDVIAKALDVAESTLKLHYAKLLSETRVIPLGEIAGEAYKIALTPLEGIDSDRLRAKVTMLCFLAKTRLRWTETHKIEHSGLQDVVPIMNVIIGGKEADTNQSDASPETAPSLKH